MKITYELDLHTFEAWSGGVDTLDRVIDEGKVAELEAALEELYPEGMDETQLNDILWFEEEWVYEVCGIRSESVIREELEEVQEEMNELMEQFIDEADGLESDEKDALWENDYAFDYEELEEKVKELEEELENI